LKKQNKNNPEDHLSKCLRCGSACCRYITVKIDTPRSMLDFDNIIWQLSHKNVRLFHDKTGWFLLVSNSCEFLAKNGKCSIYEERPITCRHHSALYCEFDSPVEKTALHYFEDAISLKKFCKKKFKKWHKRFEDNPV
jgi:Fe-S-cluster containining protein